MLSFLDLDVIIHVLSWLHARDLLSLRKTSKQFYEITHLRTVWHNALTNLLADNVPLARVSFGIDSNGNQKVLQDFTTLSASELERLVLATCHTSEAWEQTRPKRTRASRVKIQVDRVFTLRFLRIRSSLGGDEELQRAEEGRYLLSFGHNAQPTLCIQVWDVDADRTGEDRDQRPVAEWGVNGRVIGLAVDEGNGLHEYALANSASDNVKGSLIAVSARDFDVPGAVVFAFRILYFTPPGPSGEGNLSILKDFRLRGPLNARAMCGSLVAVQVRADGEGQKFGHGVLKVIDWVRSTEIYAQAPDDTWATDAGISYSGREFAVKLEPSVHGMNRTVLCVNFVHDWVIVFRESVLEMYFLPPWMVTNKPRTIYPDASYKWNWQINTMTVTERVSWVHDRMAMFCRICDRRGFVMVPTSTEDEESGRKIICACRYRPLSLVMRFDSYYPWPVNLLHHFVFHLKPHLGVAPNLQAPVAPYMLPPQLAHTIPSTKRLFGHSVLVLGRFGTLLWTDSEANNVEGGEDNGTQAYFADSIGERVAGRRLRLPPLPLTDSETCSEITSPGQQGTDPSNPEILPSSLPGPTLQTSVFSTRLSEGWYSVALCESRGRIAIGDGEGNIEFWDHF